MKSFIVKVKYKVKVVRKKKKGKKKEKKRLIWKDLFIAVLFTVAKLWKQLIIN